MRVEIMKPEQVGLVCGRYATDGFRLQTMVGADERVQSGGFVLRYVFFHDERKEQVECRTFLPPDQPFYTSATPAVPAADWYEREAYDLLGLQPVGHPHPAPLALHGVRYEGAFPLRKDFPVDGVLPPVRRVLEQTILPDGYFEVPVGPIHAGVIEPGHFRFRMKGEEVESLTATLFYTHRGLEKRAEGMTLQEGIRLAEQACGVCSVSHGLSYAQAIESLAHMRIPERAKWIRVVLAEMERLYNHVGDIGNICAGIGFSFGAMQGGRLKEILQQLNDEVTGHRYLRGMIAVGGVSRDLDRGTGEHIRSVVSQVTQEFSGVVDVLLSHEITCDRFRNTGVLSLETVRQLGVVGPAARASGRKQDARADLPYAGYAEENIAVPTYPQGDVMARVEQRIAEAFTSAALIARVLHRLENVKPATDSSRLCAPIPSIEPYQYGIGVSESPRGENVHFVMAGQDGTIERLRIRSASYANWPAISHAAPGNIIADFPLINKSFELCYACCDR